jgi:hypothetical protein
VERNPYAPPESKVDGVTEGDVAEPRPQLGGCLVALLVVMIIGNAWTSVIYILAALGKFAPPGQPRWVVPTLLIATLVNLASLAAIFNWLRWGLYVAFASAGLVFLLNIYLGANSYLATIGLIGPALLFILVLPLWKHFK